MYISGTVPASSSWDFCPSLLAFLQFSYHDPVWTEQTYSTNSVNKKTGTRKYRHQEKKKYKTLHDLIQTLQRRCFFGHFLWKDYHFKQNRRKLVGSDYGDRKCESHETVNKVLFVLLYVVLCFAFPARNVRQGFSTIAGTKLFGCVFFKKAPTMYFIWLKEENLSDKLFCMEFIWADFYLKLGALKIVPLAISSYSKGCDLFRYQTRIKWLDVSILKHWLYGRRQC